MARGQYNDSQIAAFITVFLMRSITLDELVDLRAALLEMRVPVDLSDYDAPDIVGTGGDNKNTFNISTAACVVVRRSRISGSQARQLRSDFRERFIRTSLRVHGVWAP